MYETTKIADQAGSSAAHNAREGWFDTLAQPRLAIPLLTAFSALIFMVNLGGYPLYTKGEPREAVTVLAIASGNGVILPMRAGVELPSKPLLMHWLAALLSILAGGVNEWTVRIPTALFAIGGVLACYYYVRRLFDARTAILSALMLATSVQYLQAGTGARVDMTLAFFMEIAFFEFILIAEGLTRRHTLIYVAIALAVLAKGPVGLVLPGAVAFVWIAAQRRWDVIGELRVVRGAVIVAILAGWWYVAASIIGGRAFIEKQLIAENFVRFVGGANFHQGHAHAFYYLEVALAGGFLPWTPILALVIWRTMRAPHAMDSRLSYMLTWLVVVLGFYSFAHSKRGVYLLPLYPALATMTALYIVDAIDAPAATERLVGFFSWLYGAAIALAGVAAIFALAMLWKYPSAIAAILRPFDITQRAFIYALRGGASWYVIVSVAIPFIMVALGIHLLRANAAAHELTLAIAAGMGIIAVAANVVVVPAIANATSLKTFTADAMTAVDNHPLGYLIDMDYDVAFYSQRTIPIANFKDADKFAYLLCWENIWVSRPADWQAHYQVIITSNPTELDGSGRMLLLKKISAPDEGVNV